VKLVALGIRSLPGGDSHCNSSRVAADIGGVGHDVVAQSTLFVGYNALQVAGRRCNTLAKLKLVSAQVGAADRAVLAFWTNA
jgi:hypothetical protein